MAFQALSFSPRLSEKKSKCCARKHWTTWNIFTKWPKKERANQLQQGHFQLSTCIQYRKYMICILPGSGLLSDWIPLSCIQMPSRCIIHTFRSYRVFKRFLFKQMLFNAQCKTLNFPLLIGCCACLFKAQFACVKKATCSRQR